MKVEHDIQNHRFAVHLPEGKGELVYEKIAPAILDLQHTAVDSTLRGRGVGEALVEAAMEYVRSEGMKFIPTCTYVQRWLSKHPEQQERVARKT